MGGVRFTHEQLRSVLAKKGYTADMASGIPDSLPKPNQKAALDGPAKGEEESAVRIQVSFTLYRQRLLDWDNAAASCKDLCDCLTKSRLIPDDRPEYIEGSCRQRKVKAAEEGTLIEITYP